MHGMSEFESRQMEEGVQVIAIPEIPPNCKMFYMDSTREAAARLIGEKAKTERTSYPKAVIQECAEEIRAMKEPQ